jgi:hypothetical protein
MKRLIGELPMTEQISFAPFNSWAELLEHIDGLGLAYYKSPLD